MRGRLVPPERAAIDVVGFGQNAIDHLCRVPRFPAFDSKLRLDDYDCRPGGQVATALVALARWGARAAYIGAFGDDAGGVLARGALVDAGVDVSGAPTRRATRNQIAVILIDAASGERTVLWHRDPTLAMCPEDLARERICAGRVLLLDGLDRAAAIAAAAWARAAGIPTVVDLDSAGERVHELLGHIDVAIVSRECAAEISGARDPAAALPVLAASGAALAGVTLGAEGVIARYDNTTMHVPAVRVRAVDTTGAGDVFHAAVIHALLAGWEVPRLLRFANAAAALQCTALGAQTAIPSLERIHALL